MNQTDYDQIDLEEFHESMLEFGRTLTLAFSPVIIGLSEVARKLADIEFPEITLPLLRVNLWERFEGESLVKWGKRLESFGYMDDPDIRWEYQKAMLSWVASPVMWIWRKIRD